MSRVELVVKNKAAENIYAGYTMGTFERSVNGMMISPYMVMICFIREYIIKQRIL